MINKHVWPAGASTMLTAVGGIAAITGVQLLRSLPPERMRPRYWLRALASLGPLAVGAAVMLALAPTLQSAIERVALHDRELEAVTISLPTGNEAPNPQHAADLTISGFDGLELVVGATWQIGTFDDDNARAIAEAGARNAQASAPIPLPGTALIVGRDIPHRSFRVPADSADMFVTIFPCGPRIFAVFVGGDGALALLRRIVASVRCRADAGAVPAVPAIVDLPDDWKSENAEPGQLTYVRDGEGLVVAAIDVMPDNALHGAMEAAMQHIGASARLDGRREIVTPSGARSIWIGSVKIDDVTVPLHLSALTCADQRVTLVIEHVGGTDEVASTELFGHVRCVDTRSAGPTKQ
jgi:hypothetical protein